MVEINVFRNVQNARTLAAGEVLFREGDDGGDLMFAVIEGELILSVGERVVDRLGPSQIVGEMALIDRSARSATATAGVETKVAPVDRKAFTYLVQEHPTFALMVMEVMAERLRRANQSHA
jgi:CRP-like cAMP-binding protein